VAANGETDRNVECDQNLLVAQEAATNKSFAIIVTEKKRLQLPWNPVLKLSAVSKADVLVKEINQIRQVTNNKRKATTDLMIFAYPT